jgi:hypothetical protein
MSVIINEFEVDIEPKNEEGKGRTKPPESQSVPSLTPQDIRNLIRHHAERAFRIRAH